LENLEEVENKILKALKIRGDISFEELVEVVHENPDTPVRMIIIAQNELLDKGYISTFQRIFHGRKQNHLRLIA
jgi:hypothetical protein